MRKLLVSFKYTFAALAAVLLISLSTVVFGEAENSAKQDIAANAEDCKMKAYTDPQKMAAAMANLAEFMQLVTLMSNPHTAQNMMECGLDSKQWNEIIANMSNPASFMAASGQFMNPQMYMNWMTAMMNPQTFMTTMNTFMNPALYMQWMTAMSNPAYYQPMYKMVDPTWQQESTAWMMNPASYQQMFNSFMPGPVVAETSVK